MKDNEFIADTNEHRRRNRRANVDAWLGQVKDMVQETRAEYPELSGQVLSDVKFVRTAKEGRVTLVFSKKGAR
jgi:hypothetical protein